MLHRLFHWKLFFRFDRQAAGDKLKKDLGIIKKKQITNKKEKNLGMRVQGGGEDYMSFPVIKKDTNSQNRVDGGQKEK